MKETILVVDDEDVSRFVLREALSKRGYTVEEAPDAETAIKKVAQGTFDLILLDIQLPGLSGIDAISKLKEIDPTVIILMITAFGSKEMALDAMKRGAYDFVTKPIDFEDLEATVRKTWRELEMLREARRTRAELTELQAELAVAARIQRRTHGHVWAHHSRLGLNGPGAGPATARSGVVPASSERRS